MSQVRYSPEIILWVVVWTVCDTKERRPPRGRLVLVRQWLVRECRRGAEFEQVEQRLRVRFSKLLFFSSAFGWRSFGKETFLPSTQHPTNFFKLF